MTPESRRQLVHASMAVWIVALRWTTPAQAAMLAGAAVLLNWVVLPLAGWDRGMRREGGPWIDGVKLYPVAVLIAVLVFPLPVAAVAWAVMAIGDAASNVLGRRFGSPGFLGRPDRSLVGTAAFVATALPAAAVAHAWVARTAPDERSVLAAAGASLAGAVVELIVPRGYDDNLAICLAAAVAFAALA